MRLARTAVLVAVAAALAFTSSASAAVPAAVTVKDPKGDNVSPTSAGDITGVSFTTTGTGKGKAYSPKNLVVTLALDGVPEGGGTTLYHVGWTIDGCEYYMEVAMGARLFPTFASAGCGSPEDSTGSTSTSFGFVPSVKGNSLVYKVAIKDLPNKVKTGATLTALNAFADLVEPTGFTSVGIITGQPLYDEASSSTQELVLR